MTNDVEMGLNFKPKFDENGLIPCIVQDNNTGDVLMFAYMNEDALNKTNELGEAVFYSRSRKSLWHKGEQSGLTMAVASISVDCDQDVLLLKVNLKQNGSCHNGYESCFYRNVKNDKLEFNKTEKVFNPDDVYKK
ncbi:MAG: phosphoribosyl-AMP cyclohydrolase [Alphaproteobacteria bacterium]